MKNTFKIFWIITLLAVIGFSMVACSDGGGVVSGDGEIYGCAYSQKAETSGSTHYLLTISLDEAKANITAKLGTIGSSGSFSLYGDSSISKKATWVIIEVEKDRDVVRLVEKTASGTSGFAWFKK